FGSLYSGQSSAKFGEYNGINQEGFYGLGGFDVRGGKGYDSANSALRWKLNGTNLGTTSRNLGASISEQGKWKLNLGYDELQHNITDTYQTPLQGEPGGNNFTLPTNFGTINSATGQNSTRALTTNQSNAFHTEKEYTTRRNSSLGTSYTFTEHLSAQVDYNHLEQSGAKLIGTGSQGGITLLGGGAGNSGRAEGNNIILNPTSYSTDNLNAALNWVGNNAHLTGGYYASLFHDDYNSLSWQSAQATGVSNCTGVNCYTNNTMSTAPSNSLHQANLSGGYDFTPTTKLVGGFSYGYNTQNDSYAPTSIIQATGNTPNPYNMMVGLPTSSLNGHVETTHGDLKLTNQSIKNLTLSAGFKFNERDNRTDSATYLYRDIGNDASYKGVNTPYSNRKTQYEASAAYRLTNAQNLRLAFEHEDIKRWCDKVIGGAQCISSPASDEDKVGLTYRLKAFDDVNFNAGYSFAKRNGNFDHSFVANDGKYAPTVAGTLNGRDVLGFVAYPYATRNQNLVKSGVNWQLTPKVDLGVNGNYKYDDYSATLGVQNGHSAGVNVDVAYNYQDDSSVSAYWGWQNGKRSLRNGQNGTAVVAPTNIWTNQLEDNSHTVGLLTKNGGLLGNKLEIIGDFSYARDTSGYSTQIPYSPTNGTCGLANALTCGNLSPIKNEVFSVKLTGNYKVHKNGKVALAYIYQKLNSNDYFYNGQAFGFTPNRVMPTGLQAQDYTVNVVALSYTLSF
ncbi:MAG: MtrB/PioB family decaheme-associated outer membrane protein, partial [Methylobacter sp.]|nr:MtrB/PioB family decaheme-associated outer membrane protein [Methylobacter sp.]